MLWVKIHPFTTANPHTEKLWVLTPHHYRCMGSNNLPHLFPFSYPAVSFRYFRSNNSVSQHTKQKSEMPLVTVEEFSKVLASVQLWFCRSIGIHLCVTAHWALLLQYALHLHPFVFSHGRFLWRPTLLCRSPGYPCTPSHTPVGTR